MSEIDLTLSEIISKKKITLQRPTLKKASVVKTIKAKPAEAVTMPVTQLFTSKNMGDARSRIIARKRSTITDARDQLAQLAKTGDARDKINLKRNPGAAKSGGIPALSEVAPAKPLDMRQKLNLKRGGAAVQVKKNFNNALQNGGLQSGSQGKTRMRGNALVRTVSGLTSSAPPAKRSRLSGGGSFVTAPGVTSAVQRQIVNRKRPVLQTASGLGGNVIQEFHRSHPINTVPTVVVQQQARPTQVARRRMPQQTVMAAPTTIYREVPASRGYTHAPRPLMSSGGRLGPLASRPVLVSREPAYAQPTVVYRREPTVIYQDEAPLEYADYEYSEPQEQQPIYYERSPSPVYQQEYAEEVYVSRSAPLQQQHYGPPPPPPQPRNLSYSTMDYQPRQQQQQRLQPRPQPQQQPRYQQRPQPLQRPVQQRPVQQRPVQQRPVQQRPVQQRPVQQRPVQQRPVQQQAIRRAAPVVRQVAPAPKVVGHKVVVSNLHPVATHEDIEELFGNIGHVSSCKMARPGTATVVFLNLSDAHKSVEVYHNRKLDGQPMQVKIMGSVTETGAVVAGGQQQINVRTVRARY